MEMVEYRFEEGVNSRTYPRGGPIYDPGLVGPITSVLRFQAEVLQELKGLEAELCIDSTSSFDDELSVDELRIFTEEELVEKALKVAFENEDDVDKSSLLLEYSNERMIDDPGTSNGISCSQHPTAESNDTCSPAEDYNNSMCIVNHSDKKIHRDTKKRKKRGRVFDRELRAAELESNYIEKVEELAKIKQKQDEDKAAARLHSFNGSAKFVESAPKLENMDRKKALRSVTAPMKVKPSSAVEHVPVCYPEIVLCVEIYHPRKDHKTQEFLVLGSQKLTELRDSIYCLTDQLMQTAGEYEPSGYFLIEDLFCNDLRDPSAIDYSRPIFDWLKNSKGEALEKWKHIMTGEYNWKEKSLVGDLPVSQLPDFKTTDMHKTRFCDLQFRLGSGYLYCHQGDCKHMVVIRDMRLINPDDVQNCNAYPIRTFQIRNRLHKCSVCGIYRATKVTVDDKWAQKNPCYFCENCYFLLHYKEDRSLLYDEFASYDYYQE